MMEASNPLEAVKAQAEKIVASGREIRPRLRQVVAQAAEMSQQSGQGLAHLAEAVMEGAREGFEQSVPADRHDVLRQVVDALGDGFTQTALAARLAVEEAASTGRQFATEDLVRLRDDMKAINDLFAESVWRTLKRCGSLTATELSSLAAHVGRVGERMSPVIGSLLDAIRRDPILLGKESFQGGVRAGRHAVGALFDALGGMLERAGQRLRERPDER
jgi:hypothetical protein